MAEACPPGRLGAYARLDEEGYAAVLATGSSEQLAVFIHRAASYHGGVVQDADGMARFAEEQSANPGSYTMLLTSLRGCQWISWPGLEPLQVPGLKRSVSTHLPTPTNADSCAEPNFSNDEPMPDQGSPSEAAPLPSQGSDHPVACPQQALYGEARLADNATEDNSTAKGTKRGYDTDTMAPEAEASCAAAAPQADQAFAGVAQEVQLDDSELCAEPFSSFGPLVVTAPPWKPYNILSSRLFSLVLRNPRDPRTGLILMSSTSQSLVTQTTEGIIAELGASSVALAEPSFYDTLHYDPALLAAVALCSSASDGGNSLQQLLGGMTGSFPNEGPSESAPASESASASAAAGPAGVAQQAHPEEEHGECPICYEAISAGDAAMRCSGDGGMHHYFHATCLQQWIRQCRSGQSATCPVCRGTVQFNGQRLETFLQSPSAANLDEEERTFLKSIADGLQHKNTWSDMTNLERGAFTAGIAAAAGWGFMVGYHGDSHAAYANNQLVTPHLGRDHNIAQGVGWIAGLLARIIREATRQRKRDNDRS